MEAATYATANGVEYLNLAQVCLLPGHPTSGAEVFSLIRDSELPTDQYLDAFFDTGSERQSSWDGRVSPAPRATPRPPAGPALRPTAR